MGVREERRSGLVVNEVISLAAPCGTVAPIRCQIGSDEGLVLLAEPDKGESLENAALDIIAEIIRKLQKSGCIEGQDYQTHPRNMASGPDRPDVVRISFSAVSVWLFEMMPASVWRTVKRHNDARRSSR